MLLECLDSDADASVVVVLLQWLNHLQNYSRVTSKYSPQSWNETTHRVMLNDCVSARWSLMYQYLALTSLRDSYLLPTRHQPPISGFSSHFRTSISILRFVFQRFLLAQLCVIQRNRSKHLCEHKVDQLQGSD